MTEEHTLWITLYAHTKYIHQKVMKHFFENTSQAIITAWKPNSDFVKINQTYFWKSYKPLIGTEWSFKDSDPRKATALIFMLIILQWPNVQFSNFTKMHKLITQNKNSMIQITSRLRYHVPNFSPIFMAVLSEPAYIYNGITDNPFFIGRPSCYKTNINIVGQIWYAGKQTSIKILIHRII